ncbi:hypothetical protein SK128_002304 [Halocaridina rubra]|uniref:Uncharacterized protein n=1 Tax=Halocaridina rubra TaxID=373956 RepID=A0AAN8XFU9_HALRR
MMAPFKPLLSPKASFRENSELEEAFQHSKKAIINKIKERVEIFESIVILTNAVKMDGRLSTDSLGAVTWNRVRESTLIDNELQLLTQLIEFGLQRHAMDYLKNCSCTGNTMTRCPS